MGRGHVVLKARIADRLPPVQQAHAAQHAGGGADRRHLLARRQLAAHRAGHQLAGRQVLGALAAARQHQHVKPVQIQFGRHRVRLQADTMAAAHLGVLVQPGGGHLHPGPPQQIHRQQTLALLKSVRQKYTNLFHLSSFFLPLSFMQVHTGLYEGARKDDDSHPEK